MNKKIIALITTLLIISLPIVQATQIGLQYDANGNLIYDGETYREYNSLNQLWKVYNGSDNVTLLIEYIHDPLEERVLVKKDYVNNETVYYFSKEFNRVVNDSGTYNITYVYLNGDLIAEEVNGVKRFHHNDHLGSTSVITDESGNVIERTQYDPMGNIIANGTASRYNYEAKEYSDVTGDTDFHFRQYKSEYGFFSQPDTYVQNFYEPQTMNRYMFELGNPYLYIDPTGHWTFQIGATGHAGLVLGGQAGTGLAIGSDKIFPNQFGVYAYGGGGVHTPSIAGGFEVSFSGNKYLSNLKGGTMTTGGSWTGVAFGGIEWNLPFAKNEDSNVRAYPAESSVSIPFGAGLGIPPVEFHTDYVYTVLGYFGKKPDESNLADVKGSSRNRHSYSNPVHYPEDSEGVCDGTVASDVGSSGSGKTGIPFLDAFL